MGIMTENNRSELIILFSDVIRLQHVDFTVCMTGIFSVKHKASLHWG